MVEVKSRQPGGKVTAVPAIAGTRLLGIQSRRASELVGQVQAGFPFSYLVHLEQQSGLPRQRLAQFAAIPPRTLARRQRAGQLAPEESDRLLRFARIFESLLELFEGDQDHAKRWLLASSLALGGTSPLEFMSTEVGAREVEQLIGRLEHGVFT